MRQHNKLILRVIAFTMGFSLVLLAGKIPELAAQIKRPEAAATEFYQKMPDFPPENQYINQETGKVDSDNTLIFRLISYHQYVKRRPTGFRLDWKLTMADYLGAHENIQAGSYPGYKTLKTNPLEGDLQVINGLNLRQRNQLVEVLMSIYQPQSENSNPDENVESSEEPSLNLPKPGDSELLQP